MALVGKAPLRSALLACALLGACSAEVPRGPVAPPPALVRASVRRPRWITCRYAFEGAERSVRVEATAEPYRVPDIAVATTFALKFVYVAAPEDTAAFRAYVYLSGENERVALHELTAVPPYAVGGRHGFTGAVSVYTPFGSELTYACAAVP